MTSEHDVKVALTNDDAIVEEKLPMGQSIYNQVALWIGTVHRLHLENEPCSILPQMVITLVDDRNERIKQQAALKKAQDGCGKVTGVWYCGQIGNKIICDEDFPLLCKKCEIARDAAVLAIINHK